jgi:hypothetical protein
MSGTNNILNLVEGKSEIGHYRKILIDLSVARNNTFMGESGNFFQIMELTGGAVLQVAFNSIGNAPITFDAEQHIISPFKGLYLTNTAQPGAICYLFVSTGFYYVPYFRVKSISPNINTGSYGIKACTDVASALALPASVSVVKVHLYNAGANVVYFGMDNLVTSANGFPVNPGQYYLIDFQPCYLASPIYFVCATGESASVNYIMFNTPL